LVTTSEVPPLTADVGDGWLAQGPPAVKVPVTVNGLLEGHVLLDLECLDRI